MEPLMLVYVILICLPGVIIAIDFIYYLLTGEHIRKIKKLSVAMGFVQMCYAIYFLWTDRGLVNDCCGGSATFSPQHRLSLNILVGLCMIAYVYTVLRRVIAPPIIEVIINCLLLVGIALNIFIAVHIKDWPYWLVGNVPIIMTFILALVKNHGLILDNMEEEAPGHSGRLTRFCWKLLHLRPLWKIPVLLILCLPILVLLATVLLLFGQKPDSMIRAFTDTYHLGLSQWDYKCEGVVCGGHFLCTIAAKGHSPLVRPLRTGIRAGQPIKCNRQLLISNAFEEILEQRLPRLHRLVRSLYNRVGAGIHRYYGLFDNKWISDLIYILMKPLEWFFLLVLYCFDKKPENRIAQQYLSRGDRQRIGDRGNMI
jgi:hypothetical protein